MTQFIHCVADILVWTCMGLVIILLGFFMRECVRAFRRLGQ